MAILWILASSNGKAAWTRLCKRTRLTAAELDAFLSELVRDGRISIIPRETQGANQAGILLKSERKARPWDLSSVPSRI